MEKMGGKIDIEHRSEIDHTRVLLEIERGD